MAVFYSCSTDSNLAFTHNNYSDAEIKSRSSVSKSFFDWQLEETMQWVSFIIARMLIEDEDDLYRSDFLAVSQVDGTLSLDELMDNPEFEERFSELAYIYLNADCDQIILNIDHPLHEHNKPPRPAGGGGNEDFLNCLVAPSFLEKIKNECLEIYMPEVLNFDGDFEVTSTSHPLTNDDDNEGYQWSSTSSLTTSMFFVTEWVKVDNNYLIENDNIIVVRPFNRKPKCDYSEYGVKDFTKFLNEE